MIEVSTAPPWMPCRNSSAENNPSAALRRDQLVRDHEKRMLRAQILRHQRHAALLPPWLVTITSFLMPA